MSDALPQRRMPAGAELQPAGGVHFRVWAPAAARVDVVLEGGPGFKSGQPPHQAAMEPEGNGYHALLLPAAGPGSLYRYRLDDQPEPLADPASRFQPQGPFGPSEVVDPGRYEWKDHAWRGLKMEGQVLYELHLGTFTPAGTWAAAGEQLAALADLGVTALEILPVADFPGHFGWGYDGVNLYAPTRLYGKPDDARAFVDEAHRIGLGVLLDVVYNHFGPDGNVLRSFSERYFSDRHKNDWGDGVNYDGPDSGPVREFVVQNAAYWIREFHLDGLRLDAAQEIVDESPESILSELSRAARAASAGRGVVIIAENERQDTRLLRPPEQGGFGLDAAWNDDFHHACRVALTGREEAYYSGYRGRPQEFISAVKHGYLYQGQYYRWQDKRRGTPALDLGPTAFVHYLENHDQVANSATGQHLHALADPGRLRALTALLLLGPATPMLFQGQEYGARSPFLYFADHKPDLNAAIGRGRLDFLAQFPSLATPEMRACLPNPADRATFERCKPAPDDRRAPHPLLSLHRDLLHLRRTDPVFRVQRRFGVDGAVLGRESFVLRYFGGEAGDRLLLVNLGPDLELDPASEPLLAPPGPAGWTLLWSSESPGYGGAGVAAVADDSRGWHLQGRSAVVLAPAGGA